MAGVESQTRSRIPGQRDSSASITSPTVVADSSTRLAEPGNRFTRAVGRVTTTGDSLALNDQRLHRIDRGQVLGDAAPAVALVGAGEQRARIRAEVDPGRIEPIGGHDLAQHTEERVFLGQTLPQRLPLVAAVPSPPHGGLPVGYVPARRVTI